MPDELHGATPTDAEPPRRQFLTTASGLAMTGGLLAAYGTFGVMLGRFVYPAAAQSRGWLFVCTVDRLAPGEALDFTTPAGAKIVVARQGEGRPPKTFWRCPASARTWAAAFTGRRRTIGSSVRVTTVRSTGAAARSPARRRRRINRWCDFR